MKEKKNFKKAIIGAMAGLLTSAFLVAVPKANAQLLMTNYGSPATAQANLGLGLSLLSTLMPTSYPTTKTLPLFGSMPSYLPGIGASFNPFYSGTTFSPLSTMNSLYASPLMSSLFSSPLSSSYLSPFSSLSQPAYMNVPSVFTSPSPVTSTLPLSMFNYTPMTYPYYNYTSLPTMWSGLTSTPKPTSTSSQPATPVVPGAPHTLQRALVTVDTGKLPETMMIDLGDSSFIVKGITAAVAEQNAFRGTVDKAGDTNPAGLRDGDGVFIILDAKSQGISMISSKLEGETVKDIKLNGNYELTNGYLSKATGTYIGSDLTSGSFSLAPIDEATT